MVSSLENNNVKLFVLLHSYRKTSESLMSIKNVIKEAYPNAETLTPELKTSLFSMKDANEIVCEILIKINEKLNTLSQKGINVEEIIFVGHSIGALLARKIYVISYGEISTAPFEKIYSNLKEEIEKSKKWSPKVTRIILLAGMNRGWQISYQLNILDRMIHRLGVCFAYFLYLLKRRWFLIFQIRRGAEFITQLRIQWIKMSQDTLSKKNNKNFKMNSPIVIQLLGSQDDKVSPSDNIDLVSGSDFFYLDVPHSGHGNIIKLNDSRYGKERKEMFLLALKGSEKELEDKAVIPADNYFVKPDFKVENVLFVIHGIRDQGYWTHKVARTIKRMDSINSDKWATETSSYGYFPILSFLLPWERRKKVEWLMDKYTGALAQYPNASFSYVGHSNGTYLLAKALELYSCCRFKNVVFAGSVVRRKFNWEHLIIKEKRVEALLNFVASRDWVVAIFPNFFQKTKLQDMGSAGHDGFDDFERFKGIYQIEYIKGGHSAAVEEEVWDQIASFIINGRLENKKEVEQVKGQGVFIKFLGVFPFVGWAVIILIVGIIIVAIYFLMNISITHSLVFRERLKGAITVIYMLILWLILTKA